MIQEIKSKIADKLKDSGVNTDIQLTRPPNPEMGDFAFPCFEYAKKQNNNPADIAQRLAESLDDENELFTDIQAAGPYVNFTLNTGRIGKEVVAEILEQKEDYGKSNLDQDHVLVEYPSPNTHKEFHVGHLRNICIGNALVELYKNNGYEVSVVNYVNDIGVHVAKSLWGILNLYNGEVPKENTQKWLGKVYSEASQKIAENDDLKQEVEEIKKKLTSKDEQIWNLFKKTRAASLENFDQIYEEMGVVHDKVYFQSEIVERGQELVDELIEEGIAEEGEKGAIIADLEEYDLNIALLRKSNGEGLYLTSDLALAENKFEDFNVDESVNITASEQDLHFKQLFKILDLYGFDQEMSHIGYGLVTLPEGKMSSREGNIVLYRELKEKIFTKLEQETKERHSDWPAQKIKNTAKKLTLAVLKFDLQKHEAQKNITFDIEEATSFSGYSAPYILYVVARINSLIEKSDVSLEKYTKDLSLLEEQEEKQLILKMAELKNVLKESLQDYNTSQIARYCFDLSQLFNDFYNKHQILNLEDERQIKAKLSLCLAVKQTLDNALNILTIDSLEEM